MTIKKETTLNEYLEAKGVKYRQTGKELVAHCVFNGCDDDSRGAEAHLYFNAETSQYQCKKCSEEGNMITLMKHFGDEYEKPVKAARVVKNPNFGPELVEKCAAAMPDRIREYLHERGITDELITKHKLGYGTFYGQAWITIPIKDGTGEYVFFKLRQDPLNGKNKMTYPTGTAAHPVEAQLYQWENITAMDDGLNPNPILLCEGEFDCMLLDSVSAGAVSSSAGAGTFKKEWVEKLKEVPGGVSICYDLDDAGRKGARKVAQMLHEGGVSNISIVNLPEELGEGGDITDYLMGGGDPAELYRSLATPYPEQFDLDKFKPMSSQELSEILSLTIKHDEHNKITAFLGQLSAYTDNAQFNISFNAPSSTGKSFIPTEVARLFPEEDVLEIAYSSPTAFFHENGEYDEEAGRMVIDLSRKIIIFVDMPHMELLARLRPLLSHDKKELEAKITDKSQKNGLRTKTIILLGYPSVTFCTAGLNIDEQEATRFFLLSPEVSQEKLREGIQAAIRKEADNDEYKADLEKSAGRSLLKERIRAIKQEHITEINIGDPKPIYDLLLGNDRKLKPRNQRDVKRLMSLAKSFALLNVWFRERKGTAVVANEEDVMNAIALWERISVSQELNLPPFVYDLYVDVILKAWQGKSTSLEGEFNGHIGLTYQEILAKHYEVYGRPMNPNLLAKSVIPMLESAGLLSKEKDHPLDKRLWIIYPIVGKAVDALPEEGANSADEVGVDDSADEDVPFSEFDFI